MLKEIDLAGALARMKDGSEKICMLVPVSKDTTLEELMQAKCCLYDTLVSEMGEGEKEDGTKIDWC